MLGKMKEVQAKVKEAQEKLADIRVEGEAGGGMVKATVNGQKRLLSLAIDQELVKPEDQQMMQDLVVAAVNKAMEAADLRAKEEMKKHTDGLLPNIPGMDLGGMM